MHKPFGKVVLSLFWLFVLALLSQGLSAQSWRDALCEQSRMAEGRWVKVRVSQNGIYKVTHAELRQMGFTHPEQVHVFGYGGHLLSSSFASHPETDLPLAPSYSVSDGLLFYARGSLCWYPSGEKYFSREQNYFSQSGYYFLSDCKLNDPVSLPVVPLQPSTSSPLTSFDEHQLYEYDAYSWANSGRHLFDDYDFVSGATKEYSLALPGILTDSAAWLTVSFSARSLEQETSFSVSVNDEHQGTQSLTAISSGNQFYTKATSATLHTPWQGTKSELANVAITHHRPTSVSGRLDYIAVTYTRALELNSESLSFRSLASVGKETTFSIQGATSATQVWDVTSPWNASVMEGVLENGSFKITIPAGALREFVAFNPTDAKFPSVEVVGEVPNQNLHAFPQTDMIIIVPSSGQLLLQAERLAHAHRERDSLTVTVVQASQIYNEFSSGTPDVTAYRRFLKMYHDRAKRHGVAAPRYLLLFGDCSFDARMLTSSWKHSSPDDFLLSYQSENSLVETSSFITDDYIGFLDDTEGEELSADGLDIGIGRIPVQHADDARAVVDKILAYMDNKHAGSWKQRVCYVADDGDEHLHVGQAEQLATYTETNHPELRVERIYADAYRRESSASGYTYPDATKRLLQLFEQGMLVVNYAGHGSTSAWAAENLLTQTHIRSLTSPRLPLWITATCDFTRFDDVHASAGEDALLNPSGGAIALLTTTRAVYAAQNSQLNQVFHHYLFARPQGTRLRLGDIMRLSKCDTTLSGDRNKLSFALIGDPALTLAYPEYHIAVDEFDGFSVDALSVSDDVLQISAGAKVTVRGRVLNAEGTTAEQFNGVLHPTVYDSRQRVKTLDNLGDGAFEYTEPGKILYAGTDTVQDGNFSFTFRVPLDINYSDCEGLLSLYALDREMHCEAGGVFSDFLVGGTDTDISFTDTLGPNVSIYLNEPDFRSGDDTHETPLFVALLDDSEGINVVGSGVGHDLTLCIDNAPQLTYNLNDYYQSISGDYTRGEVRFSIPELLPGKHTLTFRAWNLLNQSTLKTVEFNVVKGLKPRLLSVRCMRTPAKESTTFLITHNRPGSPLAVRLVVYDYAGRPVWSHTEQGVSAGQTYSVDWNLRNHAGQPLLPGAYVYQAFIASGGSPAATKAQKLLILAQ